MSNCCDNKIADYTIFQSNTLEIEVTCFNDDETVLDVSNFIVNIYLKKDKEDTYEDAYFHKEFEIDATPEAQNGIFNIRFESAETENFEVDDYYLYVIIQDLNVAPTLKQNLPVKIFRVTNG